MTDELTTEKLEQIELTEQLLSVGTALFSSRNLQDLLNLILTKSREITCSDAGSIYLIDRSDGVLKLIFEAAQNSSKPALSLEDFALPMTPNSLAGYVALTGESLNWADVYNLPADVPYKLDRSFDRDIAYRTRSVLVLPMRNQVGVTVGVLQLINRKIRPDVVITPENATEVTSAYSAWEERIVRSLASQAAIAIERNQLQSDLINLTTEQLTGNALVPTIFYYVLGWIRGEDVCIVTNLPEGESQTIRQPQMLWSFGSDANACLSFPNSQLDPYHAVIQCVDQQKFILLHPGRLGTSLHNGLPMRPRQDLRDGDRIHLGEISFSFFISHTEHTTDVLPSQLLTQLVHP